MSTVRQDSTEYHVEDLTVLPQDCVRWAVLIATGRYSNKDIKDLPGVNPDVDLIYERLLDPRCSFQKDNVFVLKTDDPRYDYPTLENITDALDRFLKRCGKNDLIFIYFAGHGFYDSQKEVDYYVPFEAKPIVKKGCDVSFSKEDCYSLDILRNKLSACEAKYKWVVVDACRVKLSRDRFGFVFGNNPKSNEALKETDGVLWIRSCGINQKSYEFPVSDNGKIVNHGLFSWFFCESAKKTGQIAPLCLFNDTRDRMKKECEKEKVLIQTPLWSCPNRSDYQFVFVDRARGEAAYNEACDLTLEQKYEDALKKIEEALKLEPTNKKFQNRRTTIVNLIIQAHTAQGWIYYAKGKRSEAICEANRVLEYDPTHFGASELKKKAETSVVPPKTPPRALPIDYLDSKGKEYRLIRAGSFWMGSPLTGKEVVAKYTTSSDSKYYDDAPYHKVILTQDFYLAKNPVTRGEFQRFVDATGYRTTAEKEGSAYTLLETGGWDYVKGKSWRDPGFEQTNDHPVVCVSFDDALEYVEWLNKTSKSDPDLNGTKPFYRLPTESEWEYACRAGTTTEFFWGDEEKDGEGYLNAAGTGKASNGKTWAVHFPFDAGYPATSPVGSFKKNPWGLYDMLGNVWEWTSDWYGDYPKEATTDPKGATSGSFRVLRGGSWSGFPAFCRCAYRYHGAPVRRFASFGMRVAFSLTSK